MASAVHELTLNVPLELASRFKGLTLDAGTSLTKFVYRSKDDNEDSQGKCSRVHMVTFPRCVMSEAMEFLREKVDITRSDADQQPTIHTTGVGFSELDTLVSQTFNVRVQNVGEVDCFIRSFVYLASQLPRTELLEPFITEAVADPIEQAHAWLLVLSAWRDSGVVSGRTADGRNFDEALKRLFERSSRVYVDDGHAMVDAEPDTFPCLLVTCGSLTIFTRVNQDASYQIVYTCNRSARSFLGLGNLLVEAKTYEELVDLASKGDISKVDEYAGGKTDEKDVTAPGETPGDAPDDTDVYASAMKSASVPLVAFGHAVDAKKGDLKREDIARSLLNFVAADIVERSLSSSNTHKLKRVFFCGGFCSHPFVRRVLTAEFVYRALLQMTHVEIDYLVDFDFIRPGTYLGALGCALNDVDKSVGN